MLIEHPVGDERSLYFSIIHSNPLGKFHGTFFLSGNGQIAFTETMGQLGFRNI